MKIGRVFNVNSAISIRALTNDGQYLFGGATGVTGLFYHSLNDSSIVSFGVDFMKTNYIYALLSPCIYETVSYKYIFFGTVAGDNKIKIVRWKVNKDGGESIPNTDINNISIFEFQNAGQLDGNYAMSLAITTVNSQPSLIIGTFKKQVIVFNINSGTSSIYSGCTHKTYQLVATTDYPDNCWMFDENHCYKFNLISHIETAINISANEDTFARFLYRNDKIYTQHDAINLSNDTVQQYTGEIKGTAILEDSEYIFGINYWGGVTSAPYINIAPFEDPINTLPSIDITNFSPDPFIEPYGGSAISGLTVYDNKVYGSCELLTQFVYDTASPNWIYITHPSGTARS